MPPLTPDQNIEQVVAEIMELIDNNILFDYQDFMQRYGEILDNANPSVYLKIAEKLEAFIKRNQLEFPQDEDPTNYYPPQRRIADYHDIFILAHFYKTEGIPFSFYRHHDIEKADSPLAPKEEKIPLFLEYVTTDGAKIIYHEGRHAFQGTRSYSQFHGFAFDEIFYNVLTQSLVERGGRRLAMGSLIHLRDRFMNKKDLPYWISLFYPYASFDESEVLEIIKYLKTRQESSQDRNTSIYDAVGQGNPLRLVAVVRALKMRGASSRDSLNEVEALSLGFRLWRNEEYFITSSEELQSWLNQLNRYFPDDSRIKRMEAEKMLIAFMSQVNGLQYSKQSIRFRLDLREGLSLSSKDFEYEGYVLDEQILGLELTEEQAQQLIVGFTTVAKFLSLEQQLNFGKIIYKILRNNSQLGVFQNFEQHIQLLDTLFPEYSKAKDDFLNEAIDEHEVSVEQYQWALKKTTRFAFKDDSRKVDRGFLGLEVLKESVRREPRHERRKLLLWLVGGDAKNKPADILELERENNLDASELRDVFRNLTISERKAFLDDVLKGEQGLFEVDYSPEAVKMLTETKFDTSTGRTLEELIMDRIRNKFDPENNLRMLKDNLQDSFVNLFVLSADAYEKKRAEGGYRPTSDDFFTDQDNSKFWEAADQLRPVANEMQRTIQRLAEELTQQLKELGLEQREPHYGQTSPITDQTARVLANVFLRDTLGNYDQIEHFMRFYSTPLSEELFSKLLHTFDTYTSAFLVSKQYYVDGKGGRPATLQEREVVNRLMPLIWQLASKLTDYAFQIH